MTWEKRKQRWRKMYHGRIYTISPGTLGCPATKDESYQAANAWWEVKLTEIRGQEPPDRFDLVIRQLRAGKSWLQEQGIDTVYDPTTGMVFDKGSEWADRLSRHNPTLTDRSIGHWVGRFLALRKDEVIGKALSVSQYDLIRLCLDKFKEWIGEANSIDLITPDRWVAWYQCLLTQPMSAEYKKKRLSNARNFISWLVEQGLIPGFGSLFAKRYKFASDRDEVKSVDTHRIKAIIDRASGRLKLVLLLMANTGMNQIDISNLKPSEYRGGRITRSRSKTKKQRTRVVSWQLWDTTRQLLDQYKETVGDRLFLTETKRAWIRDEMIDGKRSKTDAAQSVFRHLKAGVTLKQFRQTSGDLIKKQFGKDTGDHFLGHGQKPVDASYFSRDQEVLDQAVAWLGDEFGIT